MSNYTAAVAAIIAFAVTSLLGYIVIPYLRKLKFGQTILEIGPKWHKDKQGTPTMGGVMIVAGLLLGVSVAFGMSAIGKTDMYSELSSRRGLVTFVSGIAMALCMGFIGFLDDYIKVVKKRNLGLTARQKTIMQLLVCLGYLVALYFGDMDSTYIPFIGEITITNGFGLLFWPVALMFIYGFTNAVNLTDGLDGLASSVTLVVACAFMLASGILGNSAFNNLSAALAGACAGFLIWNAKPARVFMGDTGSMFLGGMVIALSFGINRPVLLLLAGCVYLIEALSVMLQVTSFKLTKKRIFKMAPLHHHFEMCGWGEPKVVFAFSAVAFVGCFLAVLSVVYRW